MRVSDGLGAVVRYEYDSLNRRTRETRLLSEGLTQRVDYHYDPAGRLIEVEQSADQEGCGSQFASTRYEYDRNGNIIRIQLPAGGELDTDDVSIPVVFIPGAGKLAPTPLLVRALLHLDQPSRRVIVVVYPLGQPLAEQPSLPGAPVQAVILIAYHSTQTVAHPHQPVLLVIPKGQRVNAASGTLPVLEGQEAFLLLTSLNP